MITTDRTEKAAARRFFRICPVRRVISTFRRIRWYRGLNNTYNKDDQRSTEKKGAKRRVTPKNNTRKSPAKNQV
jgi:hypothetical protein